MKKNEIGVRFADLVDKANKANAKLKDRRFWPMSESRSGKLVDFGMYDYGTKKYVLSSIYDEDAPKRLQEIERMISS